MTNLFKIKNLLLIFLFISALGLNAQYKPFQFGFKGSVNMGWFATDTDGFKDEGVRFGGSWGFVADFVMVENYSFTTGFEIIYLNGHLTLPATQTIEDHEVSGSLDRIYKSRYLQVPISFTMRTNTIKEKFKIYGQIGYGLGFLLNAKAEDVFFPDNGNAKLESNKNIYDELTFTRSSLILGLGVEIPIYKATYIRTGLTFNNCFVNMFKGDDMSMRNNFVEFSAAVLF